MMADFELYKVAHVGDLVFNKMRMWQGAVGVAPVAGLVSPDYTVGRPKPGVSSRFYALLFRTPEYLAEVMRRSRGIALDRNRLYWDQFKDISVPLPTLEEQHRISSEIEDALLEIDALMAEKEHIVDLLHEYRSAAISSAVMGGLRSRSPVGPRLESSFANLPKHWDLVPLMHLVEIHRPIMYGIVLPGPHVEDGVPIVKGGDVAPDRLRLDCLKRTAKEIEANYVRSRLRGGDLVFSIRGSIGDVEMVPSELTGANLTQDAARIAPSSKIDGTYLLYALRSAPVFAQLDAGAVGATIRGINIRDLKRARIPLPPRSEQEQIAFHLREIDASIEATTSEIGTSLRSLLDYRRSLISSALVGHLPKEAVS